MAVNANYIEAMRKAPVLDAVTEESLARAWVAGEADAGRQIVESHLRLVLRVALKFKGYGLPMADIIAEGHMGLMQALKRFDPDRGLRFSTYALWWIRAAMFEFVLNNSSLVKIGLTAERKRLFFKLRSLRSKLAGYDNAAMSDEDVAEVARRLGVRETIVREMEQLMDQPARSLDAARGPDGGETWLDSLASDAPTPEDDVSNRQEHEYRRSLLAEAWKGLSEREQRILASRRLREKPLRLEELAQLYGISRERVRQIEVASMKKLAGLMEGAATALATRRHAKALPA